MRVSALYDEANALNWKSLERQNSKHSTLLKHQDTKTALYKLPKNHWVITLFEIFGSVRNKLLVTPLSAQISASKYQNLSQSPLKTMIPWSNLRKITKRSFSDTLKLCNPFKTKTVGTNMFDLKNAGGGQGPGASRPVFIFRCSFAKFTLCK